MATNITFKPGKGQSRKANRYFQALAKDLIFGTLDGLMPKQFIFQEGGHANLKVRLWTPPRSKGVRSIVPWLRQVRRITARMVQYRLAPEDYLPIFSNCRSNEVSGFIEVLGAYAFSPREDLLLTIGLQQGRTVLLSTPRMIYVEQEQGLYGLSVFDRGSWLIENRAHQIAALNTVQ